MRTFNRLTATAFIFFASLNLGWTAESPPTNPNSAPAAPTTVLPATSPAPGTAAKGAGLTAAAQERLNNLLKEKERIDAMKGASVQTKQPTAMPTALNPAAASTPQNQPTQPIGKPPLPTQPAAAIPTTPPQRQESAETITPVRSIRTKGVEGDVAPWSTSHDAQTRNEEYEKVIGNYKGAIAEQRLIQIMPDKVAFANLSRNYVNHVRCEGEIQAVIIPEDRGMDFKLLKNKHDIYIRVGETPFTQFPLDMSLVCDGRSFIINGLVSPRTISQEIELVLPKKGELTIGEAERWKEGITKSGAMPLEDQVAKITQRVFRGEPLGYWRDLDISAAKSRWTYDHYSVLLQKAVDTNINGLLAWDFVFRGQVERQTAYNEIRKIVRGEVVSYGSYQYEGKDMMRFIVITKKKA